MIGFNFRYLYVNDAVAAQARRPPQDLLGRTMTESFPVYPDDRAAGSSCASSPCHRASASCRRTSPVRAEGKVGAGATFYFTLGGRPRAEHR